MQKGTGFLRGVRPFQFGGAIPSEAPLDGVGFHPIMSKEPLAGLRWLAKKFPTEV